MTDLSVDGGMRIKNKFVTLSNEKSACTRLDELTKEAQERNLHARQHDLDLLFSNFDFFWQNRKIIFEDDEIYFTPAGGAGLSLAYTGGGGITLGMLFKLWEQGLWSTKCPKCGGTVRLFYAGGSPLSGTNSCSGRCLCCGFLKIGCMENFIQIWQPAMRLINEARKKYSEAHPQKKSPAERAAARQGFAALSRKWRENYDNKSPAELLAEINARKAAREKSELEKIERETAALEARQLNPNATPLEQAMELIRRKIR